MLQAKYGNSSTEAGTDEAGRGCLAGPVTAAAVVLPHNFSNDLLTDSKQLTAKQRQYLKGLIEEKALAFAVSHLCQNTIDQINILNASIQAMHDALQKLTVTPDFILVDGNRFKPFNSIPHACIIKGDGKFMSIAAASILAKTYRDDFMLTLHEQFPHYNWKSNKGYPTEEHRKAIDKHGISPYHRLSFRLLPDQLRLEFE